MQPRAYKLTIAAVIVLIIGVGIFVFVNSHKAAPVVSVPVAPVQPVHTIIGSSVQGRTIDAYSYGTGSTTLVFVGGIHGGYEWNSVFLAYRFMDYLDANPDILPAGLSVTVIPDANPDAVFAVTGKEGRFDVADISTSTKALESARFNADKVDLNRNFDCKWQHTSTWKTKTVSAGTAAFSEPEAVAIRDYMLTNKPDGVIFWHSMSNAVYASQCEKGILPGTLALMNVYAAASKYPAVKEFSAYVTTGAADDWLASVGIPAITVELSTHDTIEWDKNLKGIQAVMGYFGRP